MINRNNVIAKLKNFHRHTLAQVSHSRVTYQRVLLLLPAGGAEEQAAAATLFILLCIQLGGGDEADECFKMLLPILTTILMDDNASMAARQSVSPRADQLVLLH